jgi:hypothetical protein
MISFYFFVTYFRLLLFEFIRIHQIIVICYDFVLCSFITASVERYLIIKIHHFLWIEDWDSLFFLKCRTFWWWVIIFVWGLLFFGLNYRPFNAISWRIILYLSDLWFIRRFYWIFILIFRLSWLLFNIVICILSFRIRIWVNIIIVWTRFRIWLRTDSSCFY